MRRIIVGVAACAIGVSLVFAGPIVPPPGPVDSTYKTLDEVEPRTPVNTLPGAADAVHVISQPGSYYITGNITGISSAHGIKVTASPVVIDGMGFGINGVPGSLNGIDVQGGGGAGYIHFELKNVIVTSFGGDGVRIDNVYKVTLEDISVDGCGGAGISMVTVWMLHVGSGSISNCGGAGIDVSGALTSISDTTITGCGGAGISASTPAIAGDYTFEFRNVESVVNDLQGIVVLCDAGSSSVSVDSCTASGNGGNGIDVRVADKANCWMRVAQSNTNGNGGGAASSDPGFGIICAGFTSGGVGGGLYLQCDSNGCNDNVSDGIRFDASFHDSAMAILRKIGAADNGGNGVNILGNGGPASNELSEVLASGNGLSGIRVTSVDKSTPGIMLKCLSGKNAGDGVTLVDAAAVISGGAFGGNTGFGIAVSGATQPEINIRIDNVVVVGNGAGGAIFSDCSLIARDCSFSGNTGDGLTTASTLGNIASGLFDRCSFTGNTGSGLIAAEIQARVRGCTAMDNGIFGIWGTASCNRGTFEDNHVVGNGGAIKIDGVDNLIIRNRYDVGLLGGLTVAPGNSVAPTETASTIGGATNPHANHQIP